MSTIIPVVESLVGETTASHWVGTIKTPFVYGTVEIDSDQAEIIGARIVLLIEEMCSTTKELSILEKLVQDLITPKIKSIILFVPVEREAHVIIVGQGSVCVKREGKQATLLDTQGALSGIVKKGDVFTLSSPTCKVFIGIKDIQKENKIQKRLSVIFSLFKFKKQTPGAWITMILIGIFFISVIVGIRRELMYKHDTKLQVVVQEAQRMYEEGQALLELNSVKGRERLKGAKELLAPIADIVTDKTKEERYATELYGRISSTLTTAMHIYTQEPQVFYDVGLLKLGGAISTIGLWGDTIVLGDTSQKAVYSLTVSSKTGKIIGGGTGFEQIFAVDAQGDIVYVFTQNGVHQISTETKNTKLIINKSNEWGNIKTMILFGGNIYLLDTANNRIWKYVATESSFSEMKEYLNPDTLPDLSKATGMTIDGSVWIGTSDGKIQRFTQGKENTFVYKGVDPPFGQNLTLFTSDETKNLYILDELNKRVVVVDKDGIYLAQYTWTTDVTPNQLVVAEKQGKILLLVAGKLYSIDLK